MRHYILAALLAMSAVASADDAKPYKDGPVTSLGFIRTKGGHFDDYVKFLDTQWKAEQEAGKKAGLILSYAVYSATPRSANEPDLILSITYPNMATLDKSEQFEAINDKVYGSRDAGNKGVTNRGEWREILGSELVREVILK
jgi:hypothetical protein